MTAYDRLPSIAVLLAHRLLGELFGHEPYVDPAMHLMRGAAAAFFFSRSPRLLPKPFGEPTAFVLYMLSFGLTAAVAVLWEIGEFFADFFLGTNIKRSVGNTMRNLFNRMFGAILFSVGDLLLHRNATPSRLREGDHK